MAAHRGEQPCAHVEQAGVSRVPRELRDGREVVALTVDREDFFPQHHVVRAQRDLALEARERALGLPRVHREIADEFVRVSGRLCEARKVEQVRARLIEMRAEALPVGECEIPVGEREVRLLQRKVHICDRMRLAAVARLDRREHAPDVRLCLQQFRAEIHAPARHIPLLRRLAHPCVEIPHRLLKLRERIFRLPHFPERHADADDDHRDPDQEVRIAAQKIEAHTPAINVPLAPRGKRRGLRLFAVIHRRPA